MVESNKGVIPDGRSIVAAGFWSTEKRITSTVGTQIESINSERITEIMRLIRRRVYVAKLGEQEGIPIYQSIREEAHTHACREQYRENIQDPVRQENADDFKKRQFRWVNTLIIRALTFAPIEIQREILGEANARFRRSAEPERIREFIFKKDQESDSYGINQDNLDIRNIPLDVALDIVAFTENLELMANLSENERLIMMALASEAHSQLVKRLLTNNPEVIEIGQNYFKYEDYARILRSSPGDIGEGEIGNKAVGVETARIILETPLPEFDKRFEEEYIIRNTTSESDKELKLKRWRNFQERSLEANQSFHIGARILDELIKYNSSLSTLPILKRIFTQDPAKYDDRVIFERIHASEFPPYILQHLKELYEKLVQEFEGNPIIVRSSSDLEDRGGTHQKGASFAGQYESIVCSGKADAFEEFLKAIKTVYASVYSKSVFEYRLDRGLINDEEKMGILIQRLNGEKHGKYHFPDYSGVILSHALNSAGANPEKGQVRMCAGLANAVVDNRSGRDILFDSASHNPYPDYEQETLFAVDLETGNFEELPIHQVLPFIKNPDIATVEHTNAEFLFDLNNVRRKVDLKGLLTSYQCSLICLLRYYMEKLKYALGYNVDIEFTARKTQEGKYGVKIVQCRPQAFNDKIKPTVIPENVTSENILMSSPNKLNCGSAENVRYLLYVDPESYSPNLNDVHLPEDQENPKEGLDYQEFKRLHVLINTVNERFSGQNFGLLAPGRLGNNSQFDLGISARFGDYRYAKFIMEITGGNWGDIKPSSGSHDALLIAEAGMLVLNYKLPSLNEAQNQRAPLFDFIDNADNILNQVIPNLPPHLSRWVKIVDVEAEGKKRGLKKGRLHTAAFNGEGGTATTYLAEENQNLPKPINFL